MISRQTAHNAPKTGIAVRTAIAHKINFLMFIFPLTRSRIILCIDLQAHHLGLKRSRRRSTRLRLSLFCRALGIVGVLRSQLSPPLPPLVQNHENQVNSRQNLHEIGNRNSEKRKTRDCAADCYWCSFRNGGPCRRPFDHLHFFHPFAFVSEKPRAQKEADAGTHHRSRCAHDQPEIA